MNERIGLFTGSFDPVTLGHMDIIGRASKLFDQLLIGVFYNPHKLGLFDLERRADFLRRLTADLGNVDVITSKEDLAVAVAKRYKVTHLVRGLRGSKDLEYEASFDFYNRQLAPEIETIYLLSKPEYKYLSSSGVRELISFKADIAPYVPELILEELENYRDQ